METKYPHLFRFLRANTDNELVIAACAFGGWIVGVEVPHSGKLGVTAEGYSLDGCLEDLDAHFSPTGAPG